MYRTADFPQADRLEQVGQVAIAVAKGYQADGEIEAFIGLESAGRQGRYYRLAAQILGLISNQHNYAVLTPLGHEFSLLSNRAMRMDFLARCLVETPVFREALRYIHQYKPTDSQLKLWFRASYPGAKSTADRRFQTFMSYLRDAGLLQSATIKNVLQKYAGSVVKRSVPSNRGLNGRRLKKSTFAPQSTGAEGIIRVDVDAQKRERANLVHWQLVDAKSSFLDNRELEPYANKHIDLYANAQGDVILYEMKSVAPEGSNLLPQIRKAVSQLYEYRYIYDKPNARLCIVTNHAIAKKDEWLLTNLSESNVRYEYTNTRIAERTI